VTRGERIYAIFKELHSNKNETLKARWQKVFNTDDFFSLYFYLENLYYEIELYEIELEELHIPQKIHKPVIQSTKNLILRYNLDNNLSNFAINETLFERFYGFSYQGKSEDTISLDILEDIELMKKSLEGIEDESIKIILNDIIYSLEKIQTLPKIKGKAGISSHFKEIYCKTSINKEILNQAPKEYKESFIKIFHEIDKALSLAEKWLPRGENIQSLINNFI